MLVTNWTSIAFHLRPLVLRCVPPRWYPPFIDATQEGAATARDHQRADGAVIESPAGGYPAERRPPGSFSGSCSRTNGALADNGAWTCSCRAGTSAREHGVRRGAMPVR